MATEFPSQRFRLTLDHYGKRITIELDHSDVTAEELIETFYQLAGAVCPIVSKIGRLKRYQGL